MEDVVRIPPEKFGEDLRSVALEELKSKYEELLDEELGYIIAVIDVKVDPIGKIIPGDGGTYNKVEFSLLTFKPELNEIVEGDVSDIYDTYAFVRLGPMDALLHISQIMDEVIDYDKRMGIFVGKSSKRKLMRGDPIRVRIISVSLKRGPFGKIGVTARQPFLGKLNWIEEDVKKLGEVE